MDKYEFWSSILNNIFTPVFVVIGGAVVIYVKHFADKFAKILIAKNEIAEMEKQSTVRKDLLEVIATTVESAVASNMQLANSMKRSGTKLTEDQIMELNNSAKSLIMNALPQGLTEEGGVLLDIIGGRDKLNAIIDSMMEKYVYEYKIKEGRNVVKHQSDDNNQVKLTRSLQMGRLR